MRMMPPRLSLRRLFCVVVLCGAGVVVLQNVRQNWYNSTTSTGAEPLPLQAQEQLRTNEGTTTTVAGSENTGNQVKKKQEEILVKEKPWFMKGGTIRPTPAPKDSSGHRIAKLFPSEDPLSDRIANQLMYIPPDYTDDDSTPMKKILVYNGLATWSPAQHGRSTFLNAKCPVSRCTITANREEARDADAILYKDQFLLPPIPRPINQIWILYFLECPYHTGHMKFYDVFNWTATYRRDSDIVAPYERWTYYDDNIKQISQEKNYAANKTRKVAWFVSNCGARNERLAYARELKKHIQVDIYGSCGTFKCSRSNTKKCFNLLNQDYKFYLAFENSNCRDYITEKFYVNGLGQNILPIVMGARPEDYERSAPYKSYIHVDEFESPKELADYLNRLDKNDELYNSYFKWKGTGEFINTYFWCRVCAMLHDPITKARHYEEVNDWWRGPGVCNQGSWRGRRLVKMKLEDVGRGYDVEPVDNKYDISLLDFLKKKLEVKKHLD